MIDEWGDVIEGNQRIRGWVRGAFAILTLISITALAFGWHNSIELRRAEQTSSEGLKSTEQNNLQRLAELQGRLAQVNTATSDFQNDLRTIQKRLQLNENNLKRANESGAKVRQQDVQKLDQMDLDIKTQLATKASTQDLKTINGNIHNVKTDLESTKNDLKTTRTELGILVARNHEEIESLRRLGQRDYVEFSIKGRNKPQIIGKIIAELRSVNTRKSTFTVILTLDDVSAEKKDRTVNEPITIYPRGSRDADEFVVNSVAKDMITGYLSMPKNSPSMNAGAGSPKP